MAFFVFRTRRSSFFFSMDIQLSSENYSSYNECGNVALEERDSDARPAIANLPDSIDQYDRILIGLSLIHI